jgi:hypothetical protein
VGSSSLYKIYKVFHLFGIYYLSTMIFSFWKFGPIHMWMPPTTFNNTLCSVLPCNHNNTSVINIVVAELGRNSCINVLQYCLSTCIALFLYLNNYFNYIFLSLLYYPHFYQYLFTLTQHYFKWLLLRLSVQI